MPICTRRNVINPHFPVSCLESNFGSQMKSFFCVPVCLEVQATGYIGQAVVGKHRAYNQFFHFSIDYATLILMAAVGVRRTARSSLSRVD